MIPFPKGQLIRASEIGLHYQNQGATLDEAWAVHWPAWGMSEREKATWRKDFEREWKNGRIATGVAAAESAHKRGMDADDALKSALSSGMHKESAQHFRQMYEHLEAKSAIAASKAELAAYMAANQRWPDGRTIARPGDKVFFLGAGVFGMTIATTGTVQRGGKTILVTSATSNMYGKKVPFHPSWSLVGDERIEEIRNEKNAEIAAEPKWTRPTPAASGRGSTMSVFSILASVNVGEDAQSYMFSILKAKIAHVPGATAFFARNEAAIRQLVSARYAAKIEAVRMRAVELGAEKAQAEAVAAAQALGHDYLVAAVAGVRAVLLMGRHYSPDSMPFGLFPGSTPSGIRFDPFERSASRSQTGVGVLVQALHILSDAALGALPHVRDIRRDTPSIPLGEFASTNGIRALEGFLAIAETRLMAEEIRSQRDALARLGSQRVNTYGVLTAGAQKAVRVTVEQLEIFAEHLRNYADVVDKERLHARNVSLTASVLEKMIKQRGGYSNGLAFYGAERDAFDGVELQCRSDIKVLQDHADDLDDTIQALRTSYGPDALISAFARAQPSSDATMAEKALREFALKYLRKEMIAADTFISSFPLLASYSFDPWGSNEAAMAREADQYGAAMRNARE